MAFRVLAQHFVCEMAFRDPAQKIVCAMAFRDPTQNSVCEMAFRVHVPTAALTLWLGLSRGAKHVDSPALWGCYRLAVPTLYQQHSKTTLSRRLRKNTSGTEVRESGNATIQGLGRWGCSPEPSKAHKGEALINSIPGVRAAAWDHDKEAADVNTVVVGVGEDSYLFNTQQNCFSEIR